MGGVWQMESGGYCGGVVGANLVDTNPDGKPNPPEFIMIILSRLQAPPLHTVKSVLAVSPRRDIDEIGSTILDPVNLDSGGVRWLSSAMAPGCVIIRFIMEQTVLVLMAVLAKPAAWAIWSSSLHPSH